MENVLSAEEFIDIVRQNILGCTFEEFRDHLESQFDEHMNWQNQGSYWHTDHIKPVSLATTKEELIELNHYTNFQPLFWKENLTKSNKYIKIKEMNK